MGIVNEYETAEKILVHLNLWRVQENTRPPPRVRPKKNIILMRVEPGNPPVMTTPCIRMKWPENNHSPTHEKTRRLISLFPQYYVILCHEPCYRQYTAKKIEKGETSMKRERL